MKTSTEKPCGKPPYRLMADDLREKILSGAYAGGKLPSERALLRRWGVSRATAAKALDILESDGLVVRRRGAGAFVNPASGPAPGRMFVATLIADMDVREFFSAVCGSIADRARSYNLNLIWGARREFEDLARDAPLADYVERCRASGVRGVFFVPQDSPADGGRRNREIAETLRGAGIAVVLIDRDIVPFPQRSDFDFVGIDNVQAGYRQAAHLLSRGCRRLVYVSHAKQVWTIDARFSGFRNALEENGLPADLRPRRHGGRLHAGLGENVAAGGALHRPRRHLALPPARHIVDATAGAVHRRGGGAAHVAAHGARRHAAAPDPFFRRTRRPRLLVGRRVARPAEENRSGPGSPGRDLYGSSFGREKRTACSASGP